MSLRLYNTHAMAVCQSTAIRKCWEVRFTVDFANVSANHMQATVFMTDDIMEYSNEVEMLEQTITANIR